tara:strand:+ start:324 stop:584 length:261 start_codon:yes stop_codon:yes gene_type:complete
MNSTLPLGSGRSGPEEDIAPIISTVKKIKTIAVPRLSIIVLALSKNLPSQAKIDLSVFMSYLLWVKKLKKEILRREFLETPTIKVL